MPNERKYIDAEKLNALLDDLCITDGIYDAIQSLPAADVTEVKHGKWSATGLCSNCHKLFQGGYFSYYCPNCGTIMDGEK